ADLKARDPGVGRHPGHFTAIVYKEKDGALTDPSMIASATEEGSPELIYLLEMLVGFPPQDVEGSEDLVKTKIRADWIVRGDATAEQIVAALNPILLQQCKLPVRLAIREKEREIVVARGRFRPRPLIEGKVAIELYGATLTLGGGN